MISHLHSCHPPPPPHTSSQASLDPLLVSSLYASVAGMPRLDSVRLPVGCRGESLGGLLDQNASMLVKKKHTIITRNLFFLPRQLTCSGAWDACAARRAGFLCFCLKLQGLDA